MLENTPTQSTMIELLGQPLFEVWQELCSVIDEAQTYRDGKWVMFKPTNTSEFDDYIKLLAIKRKPNRK